MKRIAFTVALGGVVLAILHPSAMIPEQVRIDTGALAGTASTAQPSVRLFKGFPLAAPPMGETRWRPPQGAPKWDGVRKAAPLGAPCAGGGRGGRGRGTAAAPGAPAAASPGQTPPAAAVAPAPPREPAR